MKPMAVLVLLLAVTSVFFLGWLLKKDRITFKAFLFWFLFWLSVAVAFTFPTLLDSAARLFGMGNRMFFIFTAAIVFSYVLLFYNYIKMRQMELTMIKLSQILSIVASDLHETKEQLKK